jgi:uncharacterized membrane protein YjjP (DUF1212 family)|tara:strand:- start:1818 stop:2066 length:249 start_codon:yes stop_codon:yes gene_type:complete
VDIFRRIDSIPAPYSTLLALVVTTLAGLFLLVFNDDRMGLVGLGMIIGGALALLLKKTAEMSDKEFLSDLSRVLKRKGDTTD